MNTLTDEHIGKDTQISQVRFVLQTIQGNRVRQSTFIHEFEIPMEIYEEMHDAGVIDHEYLRKYDIAYFEFRHGVVIVSFHCIYNREDFRSMADRYMILKAYGHYPFKANWVSKMNFDKRIELVQHEYVRRNGKKRDIRRDEEDYSNF